jgi:hypothetical protein
MSEKVISPIEVAPFVYVYEDVLKPGNFIELLEAECKQDWGYVQWMRTPTGDNSETRVDQYRSSLGCSISPLTIPENEIAIERVKPLAKATSEWVSKLEPYIWHYRNTFDINVTKNEGYTVLKYGRGAEYKGHVDHSASNSRVFSLVGFLNDVEIGGELTFPLLNNVSVKPKAGSIIMFPSNFPFYHYAKPVGETNDEVKYSFVTWFL